MGKLLGCTLSFCDNREIKESFGSAKGESSEMLVSKVGKYLIGLSNQDSGRQIQYFYSEKVHCWVHGIKYNNSMRAGESENFAKCLWGYYTSDNIKPALSRVDGIFHAVIFDDNNHEILLITDRYGFLPLYLYENNDDLAWSSEMKLIFERSKFENALNTQALNSFLQTGQLFHDSTWFLKLRLLPAATITRINAVDGVQTPDEYWNWDFIQKQKISFRDAIQQLKPIFYEAVSSRMLSEKTGVLLSGGLDSRAIIASVQDQKPNNSFAFTYGNKQSCEVKYAKKTCLKLGIPHYFKEMNSKDWLIKRFHEVWQIECGVSLLHLHFSHVRKELKDQGKNYLSGFAGDLVFRGSWINNLEENEISNYLRKMNSSYYKTSVHPIHGKDPFFIDTRVRRFTLHGILELGDINTEMPFFANTLIEYLYSLPIEFRERGKLFKNFLRTHFDHVFRTIPDANSGMLISGKSLSNIPYFIKKKIHGPCLPAIDYIRLSIENKSEIEHILLGRETILKFYVKTDLEKIINTCFQDMKMQNMILLYRFLTLEIWLQQIFNNRYRPN